MRRSAARDLCLLGCLLLCVAVQNVSGFLLNAPNAPSNSHHLTTRYTAMNATDNIARRKYSYTEASGDLFCRPFGECEPCPEDELDQPFCRPFGNRRLVHCIPRGQADPNDPYASEMEVDNPARRDADGAPNPAKQPPTLVAGSSRVLDMGHSQLGEVPAWEACGKVIAIERAGYWEFVIVNTLLLVLSLVILLVRSNSLAASQYRQLAARIGIAGGSRV